MAFYLLPSIGPVADGALSPITSCDCNTIGTELQSRLLIISDTDITTDIDIEYIVINGTTGTQFVNHAVTIGAPDAPTYVYSHPGFTPTEPGTYNYSFSVTINGVTHTYSGSFVVCPSVIIDNPACSKYRFNNTGLMAATVQVYNGDGVALFTTPPVVQAGSFYDLVMPGPGAYLLKYSYTIDSVVYDYFYEIKEFCYTKNCLIDLLRKVLCQADADPCCNSCNDEQKKKIAQLKFDLNKMIALYGYYLAAAFYDNIKYLGIVQFNDTLAGLKSLDGVIKKISELTTACGSHQCKEDVLLNQVCLPCQGK